MMDFVAGYLFGYIWALWVQPVLLQLSDRLSARWRKP